MMRQVLCVLAVQWAVLCSAATTNLNWFRTVGNQGTTTIAVGDSVRWTVTDNSQHTVSSTDGGFTGSGTLMGSGSTFTATFNAAGSFPYRCNIHNSMVGTISVLNAPTRSPTRSPTAAPTRLPTRFPTNAVGTPSMAPTVSLQPTAQPIASPTQAPSAVPSSPTYSPTPAPTAETFEYVQLTYPEVISSGSSMPATWHATIEVRAHRHGNRRVQFNTRSYCYGGRCSYPGPTIKLKPGDNFTLTLVNQLGSETGAMHHHNTIRSPNTTNVHTHGLHVNAQVDNVFLSAGPGESLVYSYEIADSHAPGLHWYHAHHHGSSALQLMGGLVGALIVEDIPGGGANLPSSLLEADTHLLVVTRLLFEQETFNGEVTQGCGANFACNPLSQGPLCTGAETTSPWNLFREYTYPEFAAEAGSRLLINEEFEGDWADRNFVFINGQHRPTIELNTSSPSILRIVHAHGAGPLLLQILGDPLKVCSLTILAWDGIYLDERLPVDMLATLNLVAAGRVDVEVMCTAPGLYKLGELLDTILWLRVNDTDSEARAVVSSLDLAAIQRPWYLQDLRDKESDEIDSTYEIFITQDNFKSDICGFWMGVGTDCSNIYPYGSAELPNTTQNDNCKFGQFGGSLGETPSAYTAANKLITFKGAINEWKLYGLGSAYHPLHVHVNHMQIISSSSSVEGSADPFYRPGQWRDTIPPVADEVTFRFIAADYTGETVMHCHFQRHEDLGMMDTYLVINESTYREYFDSIRHKHKSKDDDKSATPMVYVWISIGAGVFAIIVIASVAIYYYMLGTQPKVLPR